MTPSAGTRTPLLASLLRQQRDADDAQRVLIGCSLPPKVTGVPRGAVLLSVPRILSSVAAEAVAENGELRHTLLPRVALVRVRWWGEEKRGSTLFRPKRVAQETSRRLEDELGRERDSDGDSSLCMRYPVCVPAQQLLDYLRDMKELVLDVIDRETRKKVGRSVLPFHLDDAAISNPVDSMKKLQRSDALCEIQATAPPHAVLGYLTVNFEIEWTSTASSASAAVSTPLKWTSSATSAPAITVNPAMSSHSMRIPPEPERQVQQRLSFSSISSSSSGPILQEAQLKPVYNPRRSEEAKAANATRTLVDADRLEALLEKGRALQRSMSVATKSNDASPSATSHVDAPTTLSTSPVMSMAAMLAPYEAMTEDVDNNWELVLADAENLQHTEEADGARQRSVAQMNRRIDLIPVSLGEHNALEISFETMELEQDTIDRLRQLREGSVSTRFSPIELVVSHEHPRFLFCGGQPTENEKWIAAFAVNSSLRKRQWRTNYSHTLPLYSRGDTRQNDARAAPKQRSMRFRARCQPQHASPTGKRRRDTRQRLDLWAEVSVDELLEDRDRERVMTLPFRLMDESTQDVTKQRLPSKRQRQPAGRITVKFRFCNLQDDGNDDTRSEVKSEVFPSSEWSLGRFSGDGKDQKCQSPSPKKPRSPLLAHLQMGDAGISLFLALLIDRAAIQLAAEVAESLSHVDKRDSTIRSSLRLDYGTPPFFGHAAKTLRLKRSAKARLRRSENGVMRATVNHMNAFPIELTDELYEKIDGGLLVLEVWLQEQSKTLTSYTTETLLGVVKIPLRSFSSAMRNPDQLHEKLRHSTPFIGIDQDLPIVDPLTDNVNGQVHVRLGLGTAEQLFHFKSTLAAVVKLQSHVRGWLTRRTLHYWQRFELVDHEAHVDGDDALPHSENVLEHDHNEAGESDGKSVTSTHDDSVVSVENGWRTDSDQPVVQVEVHVEIRESYGKTSRSTVPLIGCEVYGLLRFQERHGAAALFDSSGPRFTLWWDTQDAQLNSHFVHSIQAADPVSGIQLHDMAFLFRVEPQFTVTRRDTEERAAKGVAAIDLAAVAAAGGESIDHDRDGMLLHRDIDLPIEWDESSENSYQGLYASILPLRIRLQISRLHTIYSDPQQELVLPDTISHNQQLRDRVTTLETLSRTERLLPATLRLCLDVQRITDLKELVVARHAASTRQSNGSQIEQALGRAMHQNVVEMTLVVSLCLGAELHAAERDQAAPEATVSQNDRGEWIKQFRFEDIELEVRDGVQSLPSITQGDVDVMVHPELVSSFQEGSLDIRLLLKGCDGEKPGAEATLGTVSIPLAPILFRPSGVQGSFPVHVDDDVYSGRVGVHLYVEQDDNRRQPAASTTAVKTEEANAAKLRSEQSRSSSSEDGSVGQSITQEEREERAEDYDKNEENEIDDGEHKPWYSEESITEAVGSMHKTSRSIDDRLARMATEAFDSPAAVVEPESSIGMDVLAVERSSLGHLAEPTVEDATVDVVNTTKVMNEVNDLEREAPYELEQSDSGISSNGEEKKQEEHDERDGEESYYKPITLESFGIGEIELSPVTGTSVSPLPCGSALVSPPSPGFQLGEGECGEENFREELDELSDSDSAAVDDREAERMDSDTDGDEIDMSQLEVGSPRGEESSGEGPKAALIVSLPSSPRDSFVDSSLEATHSTEEVTERRESEQVPDSGAVNDADDSSPCGDEISPRFDDQSPDPSPTEDVCTAVSIDEVPRRDMDEEDEADEDVGDSANDVADGGTIDLVSGGQSDGANSQPADELADSENRASEDCDHNGSYVAVEMVDSGSNMMPDSRNVGDENALGDEDTAMTAEEVTSSTSESVAPARRREELAVCDDSTQTEEDCIHADAAEELTSREGTLDALVSSEAIADTAPVAPSDNTADVTMATQTLIVTADQGTQPAVDEDSSPEHSSEPADSNLGSCTDSSRQQLALPAEKFNLAWQLLTEIRALYVETSVQTPTSACEAPSPIENAVHASNEEPEPHGEGEEKKAVEVATSILPGETVLIDDEVVIEEAPQHDSGAIWQRRDEASLRAEVNERLRHSQHEYEEALALSQSMSSIKSWSSSYASESQVRQVQQIASDLSASALEKRARNARAKLFRADTETERIARIMQGSLSYWIREDEDEDDDTSDGDDEDALGYF